ncbi:MAG: enoyl-CoA hydratase/isomerase family protein [Corynebacteriales bacterium]|nr:enoyl-CoA hydratase/isomerase family protein [Mycobacteriales bacterium]
MDFVRVELDNKVATVFLERPPMNPLSFQVQDELRAVAARCTEDDAVRAVILYGGEKVFAAGADIKELADLSAAQMAERVSGLNGSLTAIAQIPKPVIAAITGYALGGGLELALAADIRIAGRKAKLGFPEILLGLIPGAGGTQRAARLIGSSRTKELVYSGAMVTAEKAERWGLVNEVVDDEHVYEEAKSRAAQFAAGPARALRFAKEAIDSGLETTLAMGIAEEGQLFSELFDTEDKKIGIASFLAHGPGKAQFS